MNFITYDPSTGRILSNGNAPESMVYLQGGLGVGVLALSGDEATEYVLNDVIASRPPHTISLDKTTVLAFDQEIATLSGVPSGATVYIDDTPHTADGTAIQLTFYEPKAYQIRVDSFPALDYEVTIYAN